jgi:hypothetical protein
MNSEVTDTGSGNIVSPDHADKIEGGFVRPFVNNQLNSRIPHTIPDGEWEIGWQQSFQSVKPFQYVLQAADRIMLQGDGAWQLFDMMGKNIAVDDYGPSDIVLDPGRRIAYLVHRLGSLLAISLDDGSLEYRIPVGGTSDYRTTFFARSGNRIALTSFARSLDPHPVAPPQEIAVIEIVDMGNEPHIEDKVLLYEKEIAYKEFPVGIVLAASNGNTLVLAFTDRLLFTDFDLSKQVEFVDSFKPVALSLDDESNAYVIVKTEEGFALWRISTEGQKTLEYSLPSIKDFTYKPPIIGYGDVIFIQFPDGHLALDKSGTVKWQDRIGMRVGGMIVTRNDDLLVTIGNMIIRYDADGERKVLYYFESGTWTTPPVLTEEGRIIAATGSMLYSFQVKRG